MKSIFALIFSLLLSLPSHAAVKSESLSYQVDGQDFAAYLAYDDSLSGPRPGVLVVHEWWGHNAYARQRANMLAAEGYVALALDMYGQGKNTRHPKEAMAFMQAATAKAETIRARFAAARDLLAAHPRSQGDKIAAIGYCFGGNVVLQMAQQGEDLAAVVSFHGSLPTGPVPRQRAHDPAVLVLNGEADPLVSAESIEQFRSNMDQAGLAYEFINYPGVKHSFTNPIADQVAAEHGLPLAYDAEADQDSWQRMLALFAQTFHGD